MFRVFSQKSHEYLDGQQSYDYAWKLDHNAIGLLLQDVSNYPSLFLYPAGRKSSQPVSAYPFRYKLCNILLL